MTEKERRFAVRISICIVVFICALPFIYLLISSFYNAPNWRYREIRKEMLTVQYGDAIVRNDVKIIRGISFRVDIKPNYLSKREAFELGKNLIEVINKALEMDEKNLFGGGTVAIDITIKPVSDKETWNEYYHTFLYRSVDPESQMKWYFEGDLGDGEKYEGELLSGTE